jgi:hypothetical protein
MSIQAKNKVYLKAINLAMTNGIKISYKNGYADLTLPSGYLYNGATGLSLDVKGKTTLEAWQEIYVDVQELVANKEQWVKEN